MTEPTPDTLPRVNCPLANRDGNAFAILARFRRAARKAGWPAAEIDQVLADAMGGDYDHLLRTIVRHCR